jgi:gliding motility-associated-like protein
VSTTYFARNYQGGVWSANCASVTVAVSSPNNPTNPTSNSPQCAEVTLTATGSPTAGITWYWQGTNSNGVATNLGSGSTFTATISGTYYLRAFNSNGCWSAGSGSVSVIVDSPPTAPSTPNSNSPQCGQVNLTWSTTPSSGVSWYWQGTSSNGYSTSLGSGNTFSVSTSGTYYLRARSSSGCWSATSASLSVQVLDNPTSTISPQVMNLCQGEPSTNLMVQAAIGMGTASYQWFTTMIPESAGGSLIVGANNSSYLPPSNTSGNFYYYCNVSYSSTNCTSTSSTALVSVSSAPMIIASPLAEQTICVGGTPTLNVLTQNVSTFSQGYQWYSNFTPSNSGGSPIIGAHSASYSPVLDLPGTYYFYCELCGGVVTNVSSVHVVESPQFTSMDGQYQVACEGGSLNPLSVSVVGGANLYYQWYESVQNNTSSGVQVDNFNSGTYIPNSGQVGSMYYYCLISSLASGCGSPILSPICTVNIIPQPEILGVPDTIVGCLNYPYEPVDVEGNLDNNSTFTWHQSNTIGVYDGNFLSSTDFIPNSTTIGNSTYYFVYSSDHAGCIADTSGFYFVQVLPSATIEHIGESSLLGCVGASFELADVLATQEGYSYQLHWWLDGLSAGTSVGFDYQSPAVDETGDHELMVIMSDAMDNCGFTDSTWVPIKIVQDPIVLEELNFNQTICPFLDEVNNVAFNVGFNSLLTPPTYKWYDVNQFDSSLISLSNQNVLLPEYVDPGLYHFFCIADFENFGCNDTYSSIGEIAIENNNPLCMSTIVIPEAISPNQDGFNDWWEIQGIENYKYYSINIFNISGQEIYSIENAPPLWDGTWQGQRVPDGDYYYKLTIHDIQRVVNGAIAVRFNE